MDGLMVARPVARQRTDCGRDTAQHANSVWEASDCEEANEAKPPKNARPTPLFMAIANFPLTIAASGSGTMMAVQILTATNQPTTVSPDDNIPVGGGFNRCNFNLLAFLDGTQSRAAARLRNFLPQLDLWLNFCHFLSFCVIELIKFSVSEYLLC